LVGSSGLVTRKDQSLSVPVHIILNPESGGGAGRRFRPEVERELASRGISYTIEETTRSGHALELARGAALRGAPTIVAAGGDGTVHEVVNGMLAARTELATAEPALAVIPIGTGNDFVKNLIGGTDRESAYEVLSSGVLRHFDLGRVSWDGGSEYFMNGVGTGIDVEVVRQIMRPPHLPGVFGYLLGFFRALRRFRPLPLRLLIDGEALEQRVMITAVGNGFCLGGGFHLFPYARPDDGLLDVCIVDELNLPQIAVVLPRVLRGRHTGHPRVAMHTATSVEIEAHGEDALFFQVDGELREPPGARHLRIEVERGVLPVLTSGASTVAQTRPVPAPHAVSATGVTL
jgi:YegS/Rv2252/BmrU family lipid kinase